MAALGAGATLVLGYGLAGRYMDTLGADAATIDAGMTYLYWFLAMGNTVPALLASATRLATFVVPAVWLTTYPAFELWHLWHLSVITVALQAGATPTGA